MSWSVLHDRVVAIADDATVKVTVAAAPADGRPDDTPPATLLLLLPGYTSLTTKWLLLMIHLHLVCFTDVFLYSTTVQSYLLIK